MQINLKELTETRPLKLTRAFIIPDGLLMRKNAAFSSDAELTLDVILLSDKLRLTGSLRYRVECPCDRCLKPAAAQVLSQLNEEIPLSGAEGDSVDITGIINDAVMNAFPAKILCKKECAGLCPECGRDLNEGECGHGGAEAEKTNPFQILKQHRNNLGGK